jgi:hypothetical protein
MILLKWILSTVELFWIGYIYARIRVRFELLIVRSRIVEFNTILEISSVGPLANKVALGQFRSEHSSVILLVSFHISLCLDFIHPPQQLTA